MNQKKRKKRERKNRSSRHSKISLVFFQLPMKSISATSPVKFLSPVKFWSVFQLPPTVWLRTAEGLEPQTKSVLHCFNKKKKNPIAFSRTEFCPWEPVFDLQQVSKVYLYLTFRFHVQFYLLIPFIDIGFLLKKVMKRNCHLCCYDFFAYLLQPSGPC